MPAQWAYATAQPEVFAQLTMAGGVAAAAARWLAVAAVLAGPAVGARAATAPSTSAPVTITVQTAPPTMPAQIRYGFDIKQWGKADQLDRAAAVSRFGADGGFAVLRLPIYAGDEASDAGQPDADPQDINVRLYAPVLAAARAALTANPRVVVYANIKTPYNRASPFGRWVRGPHFPDHYARLLFNFVAYMQSQSVPVNALGILNEVGRADLAAADGWRLSYAVAYARTVRRLKSLIRSDANPYLPSRRVTPIDLYIGPDSAGPHNDLVARLDAGGLGDSVDVAATHFYSRGLHHQSTQLTDFDAWANGRSKWDTEFHWSQGRRQAHGYDEARDALLSIFANFDHGLNTLVWWNFGDDTAADPDYAIQAELQEQLVESTAGLLYLPVPSGRDLSTSVAPGNVVARAFIEATGDGARVLQLWIVNDTPNAREGVSVTTAAGSDLGSVASQAWIADTNGNLSASPTTLHTTVAGSSVVIGRIPPRSLVSVTATINE